MLIVVKRYNQGYYTAQPVSEDWKKRFREHMKAMGQVVSSQTVFQGEWELPDIIKKNRQYGDIQKGWYTHIRVDPWEYGHWLGYDAHYVALQVKPWQ